MTPTDPLVALLVAWRDDINSVPIPDLTLKGQTTWQTTLACPSPAR